MGQICDIEGCPNPGIRGAERKARNRHNLKWHPLTTKVKMGRPKRAAKQTPAEKVLAQNGYYNTWAANKRLDEGKKERDDTVKTRKRKPVMKRTYLEGTEVSVVERARIRANTDHYMPPRHVRNLAITDILMTGGKKKVIPPPVRSP